VILVVIGDPGLAAAPGVLFIILAAGGAIDTWMARRQLERHGGDGTHEAIAATLRRATSTLRDAGIPFALGGSVACWARGGPRSQNDLDLMIKASDSERAERALVAVGMRTEPAPEEWLSKVYDGEVMVDLIFNATGIGEITDELIERAEELSVLAIRMPVLAVEDVLSGKLLVISEQRLNYGPLLEIARALRERIDWDEVWNRTSRSPYARAFFALLRELEILAPPAGQHRGRGPRSLGLTS
jgi:hypothetical protein